jgi:ferredoxin-nitrite reductase
MQALQIAKDERSKKVNKIEKIKQTQTPRELYNRLEEISKNGYSSLNDAEKGFFLKCFGIFDKAEDEFMIRVRVPAGHLEPNQAKMIGEIAKEYGNDYIDITTRAQIELRYIKTKDLYTIQTKLNSVGITTHQTGVDNFRNIVTSAFDGASEDSMVTCGTIIDDLQKIFIDKDEWIGKLPRKFNTAVLGTATNDCNIYGHDCSFVLAKKADEIGFLVYLGGKVGVQATNSGIFITKDEVVETYKAIIDIFLEYGFRDNRNKNRLHFLLEAVGIDKFVEAIESKLGKTLKKGALSLVENEYKIDNGIYKLKDNLNAYYLNVASGIFSGSDMISASEIAKDCDGYIRLCVEQSLFVVAPHRYEDDIKNSELYKKYSKNSTAYLMHQVACAGTKTCKFGVIENKQDAIEMAKYLEEELPLSKDDKIRFYWSACPKGCGIHAVGDIGLEGCKAKDSEGISVDGVHIYLGGKATKEAKEARVIYKAIPLSDAKYIVKKLVQIYKDNKREKESFEEFDTRYFSKKTIDEIKSLLD